MIKWLLKMYKKKVDALEVKYDNLCKNLSSTVRQIRLAQNRWLKARKRYNMMKAYFE